MSYLRKFPFDKIKIDLSFKGHEVAGHGYHHEVARPLKKKEGYVVITKTLLASTVCLQLFGITREVHERRLCEGAALSGA